MDFDTLNRCPASTAGLGLLLTIAGLSGCATNRQSNTARTASEQLLISNAVDRSLNKVDFGPLAGVNVFVEEKYVECVDKGYIIGSIRHKLLQAGALLAPKAEEADAIMEVRSGAVGTDVSSSYLGVPGFTAPGMIGIPDIKLMTRDNQQAVAKIGIVVYGAKSRSELGEGGVSMARADDTSTYILGIGPAQSGSLRSNANRSVQTGQPIREIPNQVAIGHPAILECPDNPGDHATVALNSGDADD
ncbi:MAG TPA: DUF6655 family protein [Planctomycetaceae bacterium]